MSSPHILNGPGAVPAEQLPLSLPPPTLSPRARAPGNAETPPWRGFWRRVPATDSSDDLMADDEVLGEDEYPPYVTTPAERHRWDMARQAALRVAEDIEGDDTTVWLATRSLYNSDIPTDT